MTRSEAFTLARKRVKETGKPWLITHAKYRPRGDRLPIYDADGYEAQSSYDAEPRGHERVARISVNGSERTYDGQEAPTEASEETR